MKESNVCLHLLSSPKVCTLYRERHASSFCKLEGRIAKECQLLCSPVDRTNLCHCAALFPLLPADQGCQTSSHNVACSWTVHLLHDVTYRVLNRPYNVWREKNQQDTRIRCLLLTSFSACFGHHYAHLQENEGPVTAFGVLFWFCWMWMVAFLHSGRVFFTF